MNAFHGYTHCFLCQLQFHPNIIKGIGIEDLETMERIFSASNQLASIIRYATGYHRRLLIDAWFKQWDEDKYLNSGTFILNNMLQATEIIERDTQVLEDAKASLGITDDDLSRFEEEQRTFFAKIREEEPYDVHAVMYVELLQNMRDAENKRDKVVSRFLGFVAEEGTSAYDKAASATKKIETERRHAVERHEALNREVCALEVKLGISRGQRWTPAHPKYVEALKFLRERQYRRALEKLQRLVVQRLFELHKLNLSQTGKV